MKFLALVLALLSLTLRAPLVAAEKAPPLVVVVMDPLSKKLACDCVKGYAQRDYDKLGSYLEAKLGRPVLVEYGESLQAVLDKKTAGQADLIIGKESVVRHETAAVKLNAAPAASLLGLDGKATLTGLIVVASKDPAVSAADLKDHTILFGLSDADEKYAAALRFLKDLGVKVPAKPECVASCSVGVTHVMDLAKQGRKAAAVISSYAQPLLEGCGTIQKGDLRVVGETDPVPFITAFVNSKLSAQDQAVLLKALLAVGGEKDLCTALETKGGFVKFDAKKK